MKCRFPKLALGANSNKTELIMFARKHKVPEFKKSKLGGNMLDFKPQAKYVGIILDRSLNWRPNVKKRRKKPLVDSCETN